VLTSVTFADALKPFATPSPLAPPPPPTWGPHPSHPGDLILPLPPSNFQHPETIQATQHAPFSCLKHCDSYDRRGACEQWVVGGAIAIAMPILVMGWWKGAGKVRRSSHKLTNFTSMWGVRSGDGHKFFGGPGRRDK